MYLGLIFLTIGIIGSITILLLRLSASSKKPTDKPNVTPTPTAANPAAPTPTPAVAKKSVFVAIKGGLGDILALLPKILVLVVVVAILWKISPPIYNTFTPLFWNEIGEVTLVADKWDPKNLGWHTYNIPASSKLKYKLVVKGSYVSPNKKLPRRIYADGTERVSLGQDKIIMKNENYGCLVGTFDKEEMFYLGLRWMGYIESSPTFISLNLPPTWGVTFKSSEGGFRIKVYREKLPFSRIFSSIKNLLLKI